MIPSSSLDIPSPFPPEPMIPSMKSMSCWYLVQVKPRGEKVSSIHLDQLGLEVFCPQLKQEKIIRRVRREVVGKEEGLSKDANVTMDLLLRPLEVIPLLTLNKTHHSDHGQDDNTIVQSWEGIPEWGQKKTPASNDETVPPFC